MKLAALLFLVLAAVLFTGCAHVMPAGHGDDSEFQKYLRESETNSLPYPHGVHGGIL